MSCRAQNIGQRNKNTIARHLSLLVTRKCQWLKDKRTKKLRKFDNALILLKRANTMEIKNPNPSAKLIINTIFLNPPSFLKNLHKHRNSKNNKKNNHRFSWWYSILILFEKFICIEKLPKPIFSKAVSRYTSFAIKAESFSLSNPPLRKQY